MCSLTQMGSPSPRMNHDHWLHRWPPGTPDPKDPLRVCILAHYSSYNKLDLPLFHQLHYLTAVARVVLVTQSRLSDQDVEFLREHYCPHGVLRIPRCSGLDHTSYRAGVRHCAPHLKDAAWLWLVNDSVYGPFASMAVWKTRIFNMENVGLAAWGMTNSFQITYHLQSYFRALRKDVFQAPAFGTFMAKPWHTMDYWGVVRNGELAMFQELLHPRRTSALRSAVQQDRSNPTFRHWLDVLRRAMVVKRKLVRRYPRLRRSIHGALRQAQMDPHHLEAWLRHL